MPLLVAWQHTPTPLHPGGENPNPSPELEGMGQTYRATFNQAQGNLGDWRGGVPWLPHLC